MSPSGSTPRCSSRCPAAAPSRPTTRSTPGTSSRAIPAVLDCSTGPTSSSSQAAAWMRRRATGGACRCRDSSTSTSTAPSSAGSFRPKAGIVADAKPGLAALADALGRRAGPRRRWLGRRQPRAPFRRRSSPRSRPDRAPDLRLLAGPPRRRCRARRSPSHDAATINGWSGYFWPTYVPEGNIWPWGSAALGFALPIGNRRRGRCARPASHRVHGRRRLRLHRDGARHGGPLRPQRDGRHPQRQRVQLDRRTTSASSTAATYEVRPHQPRFRAVRAVLRGASREGRALGGRGRGRDRPLVASPGPAFVEIAAPIKYPW